MSLPNIQAPDYFEPFIGFRWWELSRPDKFVLLPLTNGKEWNPPGEPTIASCIQTRGVSGIQYIDASHEAPSIDCKCGLYAYNHPQEAYLGGPVGGTRKTHLFGIVKGWGKAIIHEKGWKSQYAEPIALVEVGSEVKYPYEKRIADEIGLPCIQYDDIDEFIEGKGVRLTNELLPIEPSSYAMIKAMEAHLIKLINTNPFADQITPTFKKKDELINLPLTSDVTLPETLNWRAIEMVIQTAEDRTNMTKTNFN